MKELIFLGGCLVVVAAVLAALGYRGREQVVGIDLGTTFSVVALKRKNTVMIVPDRLTGKALVPSVVTFFPNGSIAVGARAVALRGELPNQTVFNAKRFIGRTFSEVTEDAETHPFKVAAKSSINSTADEDKDLAGFAIPRNDLRDTWVSPIDVGAEVVKYLKDSVAEYLGYTIKRAVICVPAKFTWRETKATQQAFERAGFKVMRILEEPTAAAVAYNLHRTLDVRNVLVYDIGGGTLDTSLLYMSPKAVNVLGVAGDDHLGGSDFDKRMQYLLESKLATSKHVAQELPHMEGCHSYGLHIIAEQAKIKLSVEQNVEVYCLADDGTARMMVVTRSEFEHASADLFERTMKPIEAVLADQMMTPEDIDDVVLVGGASRTPKLRTLIQEFMGPETRLHTDIDPDITVAYGAANILD